MRERGDLTGLAAAGAGTADDGATATDSVAACICHELRRLYAIDILPSPAATGNRLPIQPNVLERTSAHSDTKTFDV